MTSYKIKTEHTNYDVCGTNLLDSIGIFMAKISSNILKLYIVVQ